MCTFNFHQSFQKDIENVTTLESIDKNSTKWFEKIISFFQINFDYYFN